jgi:RyR domain
MIMAAAYPHARMNRYDEVTVAQVCHAALRELRLRAGELAAPPWEGMDEDGRDYVISAVLEARRGITPAGHHDNWVAARLADGWTLGPKDLAARTHPDLVPFAELPEERRVAARMFLLIVAAMTEGAA